ncbi:hypothetical protein [Croceivirga sp. JEA036]|uniref:hypothetical protein n=1 Tax=Croceivirga sp. JEA036 TaxID=2721162 RepID=UPI00143AE7EC|nr:hypothetical protein [Croceivirga sp. JEA036]NJB35402.1 hypothetical protein [Croceivirga sp. JEA036]
MLKFVGISINCVGTRNIFDYISPSLSTTPNMTLYDFMMLDECDQIARLMIQGCCLAKLKRNNIVYVLYAYESFFVEFEYTTAFQGISNDPVVIDKHIFRESERLDKYTLKRVLA